MPLQSLRKLTSRRSLVQKKVEATDPTEFSETSHEGDSLEEVISIADMMNSERKSKNLRPLKHSSALDRMAQKLVNILAEYDDCSKAQVKMKTLSKLLKSGHVGQNIEIGTSFAKIHEKSVQKGSMSLEQMVLNKDFRFVGTAVAYSKKCPSHMYMVTLYRGKSN